jgi:hypothetical protein
MYIYSLQLQLVGKSMESIEQVGSNKARTLDMLVQVGYTDTDTDWFKHCQGYMRTYWAISTCPILCFKWRVLIIASYVHVGTGHELQDGSGSAATASVKMATVHDHAVPLPMLCRP